MKILIVEDEFIIAQSLSTTLKRLGYTVISICSTFEEAQSFLLKETPEIILLDIKLKGNKNGIDLAELINKTYQIPYIFLTSITDRHLLNSLKYLDPASILIKPFNKHELNAILTLIKHKEEQKKIVDSQTNTSSNTIFIKQKSEYLKLRFTDILYIKSIDVYLMVKTKDKSYKFRGTLDTYTQKLNDQFARVHRSFIVNTEHIDKVYKEHLLINEDIIPIGNTYKTTILKILKIT